MYITAMRDKKIKTENVTMTVQVVLLFLVNKICNDKFSIDAIHVLLSKEDSHKTIAQGIPTAKS